MTSSNNHKFLLWEKFSKDFVTIHSYLLEILAFELTSKYHELKMVAVSAILIWEYFLRVNCLPKIFPENIETDNDRLIIRNITDSKAKNLFCFYKVMPELLIKNIQFLKDMAIKLSDENKLKYRVFEITLSPTVKDDTIETYLKNKFNTISSHALGQEYFLFQKNDYDTHILRQTSINVLFSLILDKYDASVEPRRYLDQVIQTIHQQLNHSNMSIVNTINYYIDYRLIFKFCNKYKIEYFSRFDLEHVEIAWAAKNFQSVDYNVSLKPTMIYPCSVVEINNPDMYFKKINVEERMIMGYRCSKCQVKVFREKNHYKKTNHSKECKGTFAEVALFQTELLTDAAYWKYKCISCLYTSKDLVLIKNHIKKCVYIQNEYFSRQNINRNQEEMEETLNQITINNNNNNDEKKHYIEKFGSKMSVLVDEMYILNDWLNNFVKFDDQKYELMVNYASNIKPTNSQSNIIGLVLKKNEIRIYNSQFITTFLLLINLKTTMVVDYFCRSKSNSDDINKIQYNDLIEFKNGKLVNYDKTDKFRLQSTCSQKFVFNDTNYKSAHQKIHNDIYKLFNKIPVCLNYFDIVDLCGVGDEIDGINVNLV